MKYLSKLLSILLIGSMLCTVGCNKYDDDINSLNNRIDEIEGSMNNQISPLKTDLEAVKTQLEELISDTESLTAAHEADLATLTEANKKLSDRIKTLEDANYAKQIADAIADFNEAVVALQTQDNAFKSQLSAIEGNIAKNAEDITKVNEALAEYQVVVNAKIIELEDRIAAAEATLKNIEESVIPTMETQINKNTNDIQSILGILQILSIADQTVFDLISTLEGSVDERILAVNETITAQFNKCWSEVVRVETELNAKLDAEMLEIEALRKALNLVDGDLAYLEATVDKNYEELTNKVDAVKNHLEEYKQAVTKEIEAAVNAATDKLLETITIDITALQDKLSDLNQQYHELLADFDSFKDETNKRLTSIEEDIDAINNKLAAMVQNVTFVPEYTDGLATAVRLVGPKGSTLTATTLTAVFEVTPASAASVIAKNGCVAVEPLKTRAEILRGERLAVEVIDAAAGRVKVTAFVHDMPKDYNTYAFTLNVEVEGETVASSDYVYIHQNDEAEYEYTLVTEEDNKTLDQHSNWNAERGALVYEQKWTKASEPAIDILEGYVYKLTNGKDFYTLDEVEKKFGMAEDALSVTNSYEMSPDHAKFVKATGDATIDMHYDNEYQMYDYINAEAEVVFSTENNVFLNDSFNVYFKVTGVDVVGDAFIIEEEGDLYWLSQNQDYVFGQKKTKRVIFADNVELDMAGYCDKQYDNAPYKAIANELNTVVSIEGNNAVIKNLTVSGKEDVGVFGYVKGDISDLTVLNSDFNGNHYVGAIAARIAGSIKNCHVDGTSVVATPNLVGVNEYDNGDKVGGIVGYSEPDAANTPSGVIENCSVKNSDVTAFRDLGGIVGAMYYGDNLKNNIVENVNVLAVQRESLAPGYYKTANIGRVLGRDLMAAWNESNLASNSVVNADLRIRYAIGAEVDVNSFDTKDHTLEISTANGLAWFSNHVTDTNYYTYENVKFVEDIDFGAKLYFADDDVEFKAISNWVSNTKYRLFNFDGNNKTIYNFVYDDNKKDIALFGSFVGDIKNVKMENVALRGKGRVAPIASQLWGNIDNCHVKNLVISVHQNDEDGDKLGGIVAQMQDAGTITNCSVVDADIEGYRDLGGLAGHANLKSYDNSNKFSNVVVWVNQTHVGYESGHYPFKNEGEVVGRKTGVQTPADVEGVEIYNILYADLYRRYVVTPNNQLRLGYAKCNDKENAAALWKFAEEYKQYNDVFQVTDMQLEGMWTAIGDSFNNAFEGTYNGNGKSIKGLKIVDASTTPSGFFGFAIGSISNVNIVAPKIYGSHYAGAVAAVMYGSVMNCKVTDGEILLVPNYENNRYDNGDKAGALVGYLAANGIGNDKILNNTVENVTVKAYRDVAALVGCANNIDAMSGNVVKNCSVVVDQLTFKYPENDPKNPNIGILIGDLRADSEDSEAYSIANISNNTISGTTLAQLVEKNGQLVTETITPVEIGSK
ncbi:MAG: hypothetical protein J6U93_04220 [Alistipes sp.]|nr:hypothetical protein [Alistipes sp.]